MLIFKRAQKPLPIGGICGNDVHIWNTELSGIDRVLCDEEFLDILRRAYERRVGRSKRRGAPRMALNRLLRTQSLKHLRNWSFRDLFNEIQRNLDCRAFSQFFDEPIRSVWPRSLATAASSGCITIDGRVSMARCQRIAARHGEKPRAAAGGPIVDTEIS